MNQALKDFVSLQKKKVVKPKKSKLYYQNLANRLKIKQ